ncbi:unnamed protein product [Dimorphilus gyrociliatus]|uniref:Uncharacterized protein n=1 Tax=Dimorphilus gyrociliatus TaxID=2664684 RepID=A0A7I8WAB1_9ANNE|nr:unnamed protein product [Dimorphilus gyrociliatus]
MIILLFSDRTIACANSEGQCTWKTDCHQPTSNCTPLVESDYNVQLLADTISEKLKDITGKYPYIIQTELKRNKLDPNRDKPEATLFDPEAIKAWNDFQNYIKEAKNEIKKGLLLDIHGQSHIEKWIELSYFAKISEINSDQLQSDKSSIYTMSKRFPETKFNELIYGNESYGGLLESKGYKVVPSPSYKKPGSGNYFPAYYITMEHGSMKGGNIDAIQVETPFAYRRNLTYISRYAEDVASVTVEFLKKYYGSTSSGAERVLISIPSMILFISSFIMQLID